MWPFVVLAAAAAYFLWRKPGSHEGGEGKAAPVVSPNIVVQDGVQYGKPFPDALMKELDPLIEGYRFSDPIALTDGPLKGGAMLLYSKSVGFGTSSTPPWKIAGAKNENETAMLMAVEQIDALYAKNPPPEIRFYIVRPELAVEACKAPSAYAIT